MKKRQLECTCDTNNHSIIDQLLQHYWTLRIYLAELNYTAMAISLNFISRIEGSKQKNKTHLMVQGLPEKVSSRSNRHLTNTNNQ